MTNEEARKIALKCMSRAGSMHEDFVAAYWDHNASRYHIECAERQFKEIVDIMGFELTERN